MKIAIMQPYFFPYIGYFQLINLVDRFVIYDDVNYINRGWINRNNLLVNGLPSLITVPLEAASQNKLISDIKIVSDDKWKVKLIKTIELSYKKSPNFIGIFELLVNFLNKDYDSISAFNLSSIRMICEYLNLNTDIIPSSTIYENTNLKSQDRILDICKREKATEYYNPIGGIELYNSDYFKDSGVQINFIKTKNITYKQSNTNKFVPNLSMIDVLMNNSTFDIGEHLKNYELV